MNTEAVTATNAAMARRRNRFKQVSLRGSRSWWESFARYRSRDYIRSTRGAVKTRPVAGLTAPRVLPRLKLELSVPTAFARRRGQGSWRRCSSAGQSRRIIIFVSGVRIPAPPPPSARPKHPKPRPNDLYRIARAALAGPCGVPRGATLLVGCSGGPDSLALLHVLSELSGPFGIGLAVAHLDHGLRG